MVGGLEPAAGSAPGPPSLSPDKEEAPRMWTVALSDQEHEEHTADEIVALYAAGTIDATTFVWREGMEEWRTPFEVAELKLALISRGLTPRSSDAGSPQAPELDKPARGTPAGCARAFVVGKPAEARDYPCPG